MASFELCLVVERINVAVATRETEVNHSTRSRSRLGQVSCVCLRLAVEQGPESSATESADRKPQHISTMNRFCIHDQWNVILHGSPFLAGCENKLPPHDAANATYKTSSFGISFFGMSPKWTRCRPHSRARAMDGFFHEQLVDRDVFARIKKYATHAGQTELIRQRHRLR